MKIKLWFVILHLFFWFSIVSQVSASSDITNSWVATSSIPGTRASLVASSKNDRLYIFGGANTSDYLDIQTSLPNTSGTITGWSLANRNLPQSRFWSSLTTKNSLIYLLGGSSLSVVGSFVDTVYSSTLQASGDLSSWQTLSPLPKKSGMGAAVIVGDRIYYAGGFNSSEYISDIYMAPINSDGSFGSWTKVGDLPHRMFGFSLLEYKNNLILLGGFGNNPGATYFNQVYHATASEDGSLGPWQATSSFPEPGMYRASMMRAGNTILSVGGNNGSATLDKIYYTTVYDDGTVDAWQLSSNHLPNPVHGGAMALVNNYLYLSGGYNANTGSYLSSVYFTKLNLETELPVPLLKQTDPAWATDIYDSANIWAPSSPGISSWGCTMTSAAMVFNYHKITKLPDGTPLNPGTLNAWLKSQPDGYTKNGWVMWYALYRLSKLAKAQNPDFSFDALEYSRTGGLDKTQLKANLENNIPSILEEPGHFIVAKGISGDTFTINDPYFNKSKLSEYGDTAISVGKFTPSNSDGSYIVLLVEDGMNISMKDENGNTVGEGFTQQPLDEDGGSAKSGTPKYFYHVSKPISGMYAVTLLSESMKPYSMDVFMYDVDGNVKQTQFTGVVGNEIPDTFSINFNAQNSTVSVATQNYTFDTLIADLNLLRSQGKITNVGIYLALKIKAQIAKSLAPKGKAAAKALLDSFIKQLNSNRGKTVLEDAFQILSPEAIYLRDNL